MIEHRFPSPSDTDFADRFRAAVGGRNHRYLDDVASYLLERILSRDHFDDLESITAFCADPNNLTNWLPSEADRILVSGGLVDGLRKIGSRAARAIPHNAQNRNCDSTAGE